MPPSVIKRFFPLEDKVCPLSEAQLPPPPPWRDFSRLRPSEKSCEYPPTLPPEESENRFRGGGMVINEEVADAVNAALILRRPLLVTGKPGIGKSSLAYAIAYRLALGRVLVWPITSRSTLRQGLYDYDAVARLESASRRHHARATGSAPESGEATQGGRPSVWTEEDDIGKYIRLGPVGTALLPRGLPRVLLIDEIDKSDVDLPNDLLHVFEEGRYRIDELARLPEENRSKAVHVFPHDSNNLVPVPRDWVQCQSFPVVIMTSNGEREFPPAFNRRCVRVTIPEPDEKQLAEIVASRLFAQADVVSKIGGEELPDSVKELVGQFIARRDAGGFDGSKQELAVDQLLNAVYLLLNEYLPSDRTSVRDLILKSLTDTGGTR